MLGDVVLCPSVAAEQATAAGHSLDVRAVPAVHARNPAPARATTTVTPTRSARCSSCRRGILADWAARTGRETDPHAGCRDTAGRDSNVSTARRHRADRRDLPHPAGRPARLRRLRAGPRVGGTGRRVSARGAQGRPCAARDRQRPRALHEPAVAAAGHVRADRDGARHDRRARASSATRGTSRC